MLDDELLTEEGPAGPLVDDAAHMASRIQALDSSWVNGPALPTEGGAWRPHLMKRDGSAILHVHLADELRPFIVRRTEALRQQGKRIHIALKFESLWDWETDLLLQLNRLDAEVHVLKGSTVSRAAHVLAAIADVGVAVKPGLRKMLATEAWERRGEGSAYLRGQRFEGLLAFLLSQVTDFRVAERNYRGDTDELDIVVQLDHFSSRCWSESGVPFVIVEAKNWKDPVDQREVSVLMTKVRTKRGRVRVGLLFGASGFTSDARAQELKEAMTDYLIALLGPNEITEWIDAPDGDDYLERLVRRAMLR